VAFIPGSNFSVEGGYANTMRLSHSNNSPEQTGEGVRRLGGVLREAWVGVSVLREFGSVGLRRFAGE
jgi:hypothetical protein